MPRFVPIEDNQRFIPLDEQPSQPKAPWYERAFDATKSFVTGEGRKEDFPEVPYSALKQMSDKGINPLSARTVEGQLELLKKTFPKANIAGPDKYGNQLVTLGQPTGQVFGKDYPAEQKFYLNKPGLSLQDVTGEAGALIERAAPPVAASLLTGGLGWLPASGIVGATGVASEGLSQAKTESQGAGEGFDVNEMAKVGALSFFGESGGRLASATILPALGKVWTRLTGQTSRPAQIIKPDGSLTDDALAALKRMGVSPDELGEAVRQEMQRNMAQGLTPDQALRAADFEAVGMRGPAGPTTGQLTRDFGQQQFEVETLGKSSNPFLQRPMAERMVAQNRALLSSADELQGMVGGTPDELIAGISTKTALRGKMADADEATSAAYRVAREALKDKPIDMGGVSSKLNELEDFAAVSPELDVVKKTLARFGAIADDGKPGAVTAEQAELIVQRINQMWEGASNQTRQMVLRPLKESIDDAIEKAAGTVSPFKAARATASAKHAEFSQKDIVEAIVNKKAQFTDTIPDEQVVKKVVLAGSIDDLNKVKLSLNTGTEAQREAGKEAWDNIRAATTKKLMDSALSGSARNEAGEVIFNANALQKELDKIGLKKLRMIYTQPEIEKLYAIKRAGQALIPLRSAVNYSNTSSALKARFNNLAKELPGGKYFTDFWERGAMKRALAGKPVSETARKELMRKRIAPKVGVASGTQLSREE